MDGLENQLSLMGKQTPWYLLWWQEWCPHHNATLAVVESAVTCETVVMYCKDCGKMEIKTDCR
ncbi:MAG: hypothetical protein AAF717_00205 [Bacteroidota bacterium]